MSQYRRPRTRTYLTPVSGIAAAVLLFALVHSTQSMAAPSIVWSPPSIAGEIGTGQSLPIVVSFKASENLQNVTLRVVPEIASLVRISPSTVGAVAKGQSVNVTVMLAAPATTPIGTTSGTVHVQAGTATIAKPLPVSVTYRGDLPPDPGIAGTQTLLGIDSDGDGVRDDVQRFIGFSYPTSKKTRYALTELAKVNDERLAAGAGLPAPAMDIAEAFNRAYECLYYSTSGNAKSANAALLAATLNTMDRLTAYLAFHELIAGQTFDLPPAETWRSSCNGFDPDALGE